jgi:mono/diheme cytochrome c family protein
MRTLVLCSLLGVALAACRPGQHLTPTSAARATAEPARAAYMKYCASCHGPTGRGDGVASSFLNPKPTDLTQFSKRNGGVFPFDQVQSAIDGTRAVRGHGSSDMPVWGEAFNPSAAQASAMEADVRGKLQLITEYVRSLQVQ